MAKVIHDVEKWIRALPLKDEEGNLQKPEVIVSKIRRYEDVAELDSYAQDVLATSKGILEDEQLQSIQEIHTLYKIKAEKREKQLSKKVAKLSGELKGRVEAASDIQLKITESTDNDEKAKLIKELQVHKEELRRLATEKTEAERETDRYRRQDIESVFGELKERAPDLTTTLATIDSLSRPDYFRNVVLTEAEEDFQSAKEAVSKMDISNYVLSFYRDQEFAKLLDGVNTGKTVPSIKQVVEGIKKLQSYGKETTQDMDSFKRLGEIIVRPLGGRFSKARAQILADLQVDAIEETYQKTSELLKDVNDLIKEGDFVYEEERRLYQDFRDTLAILLPHLHSGKRILLAQHTPQLSLLLTGSYLLAAENAPKDIGDLNVWLYSKPVRQKTEKLSDTDKIHAKFNFNDGEIGSALLFINGDTPFEPPSETYKALAHVTAYQLHKNTKGALNGR